jgi:hypothetical protein
MSSASLAGFILDVYITREKFLQIRNEAVFRFSDFEQ